PQCMVLFAQLRRQQDVEKFEDLLAWLTLNLPLEDPACNPEISFPTADLAATNSHSGRHNKNPEKESYLSVQTQMQAAQSCKIMSEDQILPCDPSLPD